MTRFKGYYLEVFEEDWFQKCIFQQILNLYYWVSLVETYVLVMNVKKKKKSDMKLRFAFSHLIFPALCVLPIPMEVVIVRQKRFKLSLLWQYRHGLPVVQKILCRTR